MSKTWRRYDGHKDGTPGAKKEASRKFRRRNNLDVSNGKWYRKDYPQWDICDWNYTRHIDIQKIEYLAPEMEWYDKQYPDGGVWRQPRVQAYLPKVIRWVTPEGKRRWRLPQNEILPHGWTFNQETCQYHKPNDKWYNRVTASEWSTTLVWIDHGKPVWSEVPRYKPWRDEVREERNARNYRYTQRWPRYHRRDYRMARKNKGCVVSS